MTHALVVALSMLAFGVVGCGADTEQPGPSAQRDPALDNRTPEKATGPGLIASALTHIDSADVESLGWAKPNVQHAALLGVEPGPGFVSIDLTDGTSLMMSVGPFVEGEAPAACGGDSDYREIRCENEPYRFIGRLDQDAATADLPDYEARTYDPTRGDVLIQMTSDRSEHAVVDLIQALLDDPNLGMETTAALNARGAALANIEELRLQVAVTPVR